MKPIIDSGQATTNTSPERTVGRSMSLPGEPWFDVSGPVLDWTNCV